jgi:hypothetical protein
MLLQWTRRKCSATWPDFDSSNSHGFRKTQTDPCVIFETRKSAM